MPDRVNILLVDDQPRNLDALEIILDTPELAFVRAQSADEALLALLRAEFAAIILDINMPGTGGLELAGMIKQRKRTQHVPILFLTAHTVEETDVLRGYDVGAVDYLQKPINPGILRSKVAVFVDLFRKTRALAQANQDLAAEILQRQQAQEELRQSNEALEARVQDRTGNLVAANEALRDSEERFRTMADTVPDIIFTNRARGECDYISGRFYEYTGFAPGAGDELGWVRAVHPQDARAMARKWARSIRSRQVFNFEHRLRSAAGEYRWFRTIARPIADRDGLGMVVRWFGASMDIHDLKMTQAELSRHQAHLEEQVAERTHALMLSQRRLGQQERLATIGTLAAGLGHDMSNLLLPIRVRLENLSRSRLSPDEASDVAAIREAASYLQRLASALRLLSVDPERVHETEKATDLTTWWSDVEGLFRAAVPRGIQLSGEFPPEIPAAAFSPSRLTQVVFNLVQNAGEAFISTSRASDDKTHAIRITACRSDADPEHDGRTNGSSQHGVVIRVTDNGPGMSAEVAARCFEPYFSTKVRAVSTGMGLPMVRGLVESVGGSITVTTSPGRGATFTIRLPAAVTLSSRRLLPAERLRVALTLTDPRFAGFTSAIATEGGALSEAWDGDGVPEADIWIVSGAAASPERVAAFIADGANRRVVVLADAPDGAQPPAQPASAIYRRVAYAGRQPPISALRRLVQESLQSASESVKPAQPSALLAPSTT